MWESRKREPVTQVRGMEKESRKASQVQQKTITWLTRKTMRGVLKRNQQRQATCLDSVSES